MDQVCPFPFWLNYIYNMYPLQVGYGWDWRQKGTWAPTAVNDWYQRMEILLKKREANTNPNNRFFFTRLSGDSINHIRHRDCLTKQCRGPKLKEPNLITSTCHRKYVVTVSPLLDLQEKELDGLARHIGHDIRVHREYYRLIESGAGKSQQNIGTSWWGKHPSSHWEIFEWSRGWCWLVKHPCLVLVDHNPFKFCT